MCVRRRFPQIERARYNVSGRLPFSRRQTSRPHHPSFPPCTCVGYEHLAPNIQHPTSTPTSRCPSTNRRDDSPFPPSIADYSVPCCAVPCRSHAVPSHPHSSTKHARLARPLYVFLSFLIFHSMRVDPGTEHPTPWPPNGKNRKKQKKRKKTVQES